MTKISVWCRRPFAIMVLMLMGFNQQISHGGLTFDLQTEHQPTGEQDLLVSQLFFQGCVVSARQSTLRRLEPRSAVSLQSLLREQHGQLLRDLVDGRFDEQISATPGTGEFRSVSIDGGDRARARARFTRGLSLLKQAAEHWAEASRLEPSNRRLAVASRSILSLFGDLTRQGSARTQTDSAPVSVQPADGGHPELMRKRVAERHFTNGLNRARDGQLEQALKEWQAAIALDPSNPIFRINLNLLEKRKKS